MLSVPKKKKKKIRTILAFLYLIVKCLSIYYVSWDSAGKKTGQLLLEAMPRIQRCHSPKGDVLQGRPTWKR